MTTTIERPRDGRADFDFLLGSWRVFNRRLKARLRGSSEWEEFPSTCRARSILSGFGNMDEFTIDLPPAASKRSRCGSTTP
jgi:hypothetical protein